ncbi:hypothetical protein GPECTOR_14g247 [Gonium pectorale]|uniref:Uncharacterized protein n=1 Tax=Gonium pectorale TaxID=33097 RepID=A0A150GML4_GONPE|nr:hypothetical protein GPECTOR_14g247 [Gonium pectorale]|eukprot:KXZ51005.1 hypothetical protein GPECTOR_14g247 [Gonium pectorale]
MPPLTAIRTASSQPTLFQLQRAGVAAYVIPANGKTSYLSTERAEVNMWKPLQLAIWVAAGGTLVLLDGARAGVEGNTLAPLLDLLLTEAEPPRCKSRVFASEQRLFRRVEAVGAMGALPSSIKVRSSCSHWLSLRTGSS